jgi:hypothetical protein
MLREFVRALFGAQLGRQHMLMADAFRETQGWRLNIDAVQHLVEQRGSWNGVAFHSWATVEMPAR